MSAPIFISYSSKDQDMAETICRALEARGHQCWISCRDVSPGQNFQEAIVQALRSAQVMLLVFTANANNSDEIKKELVLAGRHRVTVVPIRVEDVAPNDAFAYELATRQWIDLFSDWEQEIERLAVRIGQILQTGKPPDGAGAEAATVAGARRRIGAGRRSGRVVVVLGARCRPAGDRRGRPLPAAVRAPAIGGGARPAADGRRGVGGRAIAVLAIGRIAGEARAARAAACTCTGPITTRATATHAGDGAAGARATRSAAKPQRAAGIVSGRNTQCR